MVLITNALVLVVLAVAFLSNTELEPATGKDILKGFTLRCVENKGADLTVVLPDSIDADAELLDVELKQVADGRCGISCGLSSPI